MRASAGHPILRASAFLLLILTSVTPATSAASAPRRVASLFLAADEVLVEILPPERLVAVTAMVDDPETSNIVGRVTATVMRFRHADVERLIALRPDLVVVSEYNNADFLHLLRRTGLRTHVFEGLDSIAGIRHAILSLGQAVGEPRAAQRLVARMDSRLANLERRLAGVHRPRVLYWSTPYTSGAGTAIGALIECGGGVNAARVAGLSGLVPIGAERAFSMDPDVLLVDEISDKSAPLSSHPLLSHLRAIRHGHVVRAPTRSLFTLSHHFAAACEHVARALHPNHVPGAGDE
jgi:iron complex transport system substrate-binding protein